MEQTFNNVVVVRSIVLVVQRLWIESDTRLGGIDNRANTFAHTSLGRPVLLTVWVAAG